MYYDVSRVATDPAAARRAHAEFLEDMTFLQAVDWVDSQTRAVIVEIALRNPTLQRSCSSYKLADWINS